MLVPFSCLLSSAGKHLFSRGFPSQLKLCYATAAPKPFFYQDILKFDKEPELPWKKISCALLCLILAPLVSYFKEFSNM